MHKLQFDPFAPPFLRPEFNPFGSTFFPLSSVVTVNNRTRRGGRTRLSPFTHVPSLVRCPFSGMTHLTLSPWNDTRKWRGVRCILTEIRRNPSPSFCGAPVADVDFWPVGLLPPPCAVLISAAPKESSFVPKMERSDLALGASLSPAPPCSVGQDAAGVGGFVMPRTYFTFPLFFFLALCLEKQIPL